MARKFSGGAPPSKQMVWLVFGLLALWMVAIITGTRLPYLYTKFSFSVRIFLLFPLLFGPLLYFGYIYRKPNQSTSYIRLMRQQSTRKKRVMGTAYGLLGLVLIPGTLAWTSIAFPAWATQLFASERYEHVFRIDDITRRSGAKWSALFDLELSDSTNNKVTLRLSRSRYEKNHWKSGEQICVLGRTWVFGTIIDDTSRYLDRCDK